MTVNQAMARFRASLLRRASAVAWLVIVVISAQALRHQVFTQQSFWIPTAGLALLLVLTGFAPLDQLMATRLAPWVSGIWLGGLASAIVGLALVPELTTTAQPVLFGVAAVSGLLLLWWAHATFVLLLVVANALVALDSGRVQSAAEMAALSVTMLVVAAVTALIGFEFEREVGRSSSREAELDRRRLDLERLYAVSATLAGAEKLSEVVPELIGTICRYLHAEVGAVLMYDPDRHRLEVMSPIWVRGNTVDTDRISLDVAGPGVVTQTFRANKPILVRRVDRESDAHVFLRDLGVAQALVAPLRVETTRVGVIVVGDPEDTEFGDEQLEQLGSLSAPAGLVLSQIGRYEAQAEMTRRLEEVAKMKTDFVSTVSHELRTPLTSIIGSLDTVNRPELAPPEATAQQLLATARRQAGRLQRLIDDLLIVSRIDRGVIPVHPEALRLQDVFEEVIRVVAIEPTAKVDPGDLTVHADRDHLLRILINLVENAVKYAPGSPVELWAWEQANRAVLSVVDHGPGIPAAQKTQVFERFTQVDQSDTRSRGGIGLGLSIVKSLTEVMGGSVRVDDTEGGGATFVVDLPLAGR